MHQDWTPVVFSSKTPSSGARAAAAPSSRPPASASHRMRQLADETLELKHTRVGADVRAAIAQARQTRGWKRQGLAARLSMPVKLVEEYETGKAVLHDNAVIARFERALGVQLPRPPKRGRA